MRHVADLYLNNLLTRLRGCDPQDDAYFKLGHAEGACAVFRDLRMLTPEQDLVWRRKFRATYALQKK